MRGTCWLCVLVCARGLQPPPTPVARPRLRPLGASSMELEFGSLRISAYEGRLAVQWGVRFAGLAGYRQGVVGARACRVGG